MAGPVRVNTAARGRRRLLLAALVTAGLVALVVVVIRIWNPAPPAAVLAVAPAEVESLALPANVYSASAARRLADELPAAVTGASVTIAGPSDAGSWWEAIPPDNRPAVVFFAAHGGVTQGKPVLWLKPDRPLPVADIILKLGELPVDRPKVLILDGAQVASDWSRGQLVNDFARAVKALDADIQRVPNLIVILSADEDQRSWVSEEWREPIFSFYLREGLKGAAGDRDPRISARRLVSFLSERVKAWASANRDADQTVVLLPNVDGPTRADRIELASVADAYQKPLAATAPGATFTVPPEVVSAWQQAEGLAARQPPPESVAPHLWREYLETALRLDELARAGADLGPTRRKLDSLEKALTTTVGPTRAAAAVNALPASRGLKLAAVEPNRAVFQALWSAPTDAARKAVWEREEAATPDRLMLRLGVTRELIEQAQTGAVPMTREGLTKAEAVLSLIDSPAGRPVEAHFLRMLHAHLPDPAPSVDLIRSAVTVRAMAEQVAWLGGAGPTEAVSIETVFPWIRPTVTESDAARRLGEDLLFGPDQASWTRARGHLTTAEEGYRRADEMARSVTAAVRTRDRTRTRLPYYARWVADYQGDLPAAEIESLLQGVEKAAAGAHRLDELLATPPADPGAAVKPLVAATKETEENLTAVVAAFDREVGRLGGAVLPSAWHSIDNALQVPFIPAARRDQLLRELRNISHQLNDKFEGLAAPPPTAGRRLTARERGQRHGRVALALLGERWITDPTSRLAAPPAAVFVGMGEIAQRIARPNESAWWESIRAAGDQIGWHLRAIPGGVAAARSQADAGPLEQALTHLVRASELGRLADPTAPLGKDVNPIADERRLRTHDLLIWHADRTVADGWAEIAPLPGTEPYCVVAAGRFVSTAEALAVGDRAGLDSRELARRTAPVTAARGRIKPPAFTLTFPRDLDLTDDTNWKVDYLLAPPRGIAVGFPVLRYADPQGPFKPADDSRPKAEVIADFAGRDQTTPVTRTARYLLTGKSVDAGGTVSASLLYRGHVRPMPTQVSLAGRPTVEWIHRPPTGPASFVVLGNESLRYGAVTLLLDGSLSMNDPVAPGGRRKFDAACDALEKVLANLDRRAWLTVAYFGGGSDDSPGMARVFGPAERWNPNEVMKAVRGKEPFGDTTPLAAAMSTAIREDAYWPRKFGGFRNLVVLSDGDDTVCPVKPPGRKVVSTLVNNPDDVALHLILFGDPASLKKAKEQFETITNPEHFEEAFRTPGRLWSDADDTEKLVRYLEEAMLPRVQILQDEGKLRRLARGTGVTLIGEDLWREPQSLEAGRYQLRALGSYHWLRLEPGDRAVLRMTREGGKIRLALPTLPETRPEILGANRFTRKEGPVRLTVPKNSFTDRAKGYDLQLEAVLEKSPDGRFDDLARVNPVFAWFEVRTEGVVDPPRQSLRIENLAERTAPAWQLTVSPWLPGSGGGEVRANPAPAAVSAYWVDDWPGEVARIDLPALRDAAGGVPETHRRFTVGGVAVEILGLYMADDALHVRLKHDPGKPVLARLTGLRENPRLGQEEEHRFYAPAAVYSARFGRFNPADRDRPVTLLVYPLDAVKRVARKLELPLPQPEFNAPGWLPVIPAAALAKEAGR